MGGCRSLGLDFSVFKHPLMTPRASRSPRSGPAIPCPWRWRAPRSRPRRQCHTPLSPPRSSPPASGQGRPPHRPSWTRPSFRVLSGIVSWYKRPALAGSLKQH